MILPSLEKTESAALVATGGKLYGLMVATDGTNAVTVDLYDNASAASGASLCPTFVVTSSATDRVQYFPFPGVRFKNGVYASVTLGAGSCSFMAYYEPLP